MKCPICKGKGELPLPRHALQRHEKRAMAKTLVKNGYSLRQIMRFVGFHSPQSVRQLLQ